MATISATAGTAGPDTGSAREAIFARHTSLAPGSSRRVNRSQVMESFLLVQGTFTTCDSERSRPSRTIQARTVKPPRCSSATFTATGHCVRLGSVQNRSSTSPARDTSTSTRPEP